MSYNWLYLQCECPSFSIVPNSAYFLFQLCTFCLMENALPFIFFYILTYADSELAQKLIDNCIIGALQSIYNSGIVYLMKEIKRNFICLREREIYI